MFTTVYAAETQFRLDAVRRDRELAHLVSIREHLAARSTAAHPALRRARTVTAPRVVWARPIGLAERLAARQPSVVATACCV